jgi:hypothetical protein
MSKVPLIISNPHLRDPKKLRQGIITSVSSNTSVETGETAKKIAERLRGTPDLPPAKAGK